MGPTSDETDQKESDGSTIRDLTLTETDPRFDPSEMIDCEKCSRANPPDRTACLYCGQPFASSLIQSDIAKVNYKQPEAWESGYSVIFSGKVAPTDESIAAAADLLKIDEEKLQKLLAVKASVPLIYLRSLTDANVLASQLSQNGFDCAIAGDDLLQAATPPTRVRSIIFERDEVLLQDFNTERFPPVAINDPVLIVTGSLIKTSSEVKGKITKRVMKNAEESLAVSDETVIDLYPPNDFYGFRIRALGFDFSCLGERKQQIASANMAVLIDELRARFANAVFVDAFKTAGPLIGEIWPPDEIRQSSSVTRSTLGGVHKQKLTVLDNSVQFTKFSRLQRHIR